MFDGRKAHLLVYVFLGKKKNQSSAENKGRRVNHGARWVK